MQDAIEKLGRSTIQHGTLNDRIYLMKLARDEAQDTPKRLEELAKKENYSKIFAKIPADLVDPFERSGYRTEARIPGFFNGRTDVLFMGKYLDEKRSDPLAPQRCKEVLEAAHAKANAAQRRAPEFEYVQRLCAESDAEEMAALYGKVFATYPFPIDKPDYIRETMRTHVVYFGIWVQGKLAALASSEMDEKSQNVEMTDFATNPDFRRSGLAVMLLDSMEAEMVHRNQITAYTIARATSFGMNITFSKLGYEFGGTLINNTNISGDFESMNVWYKTLRPID